MAGKLFPIVTQPGIKRDGTIFAGNYYIDGLWTRFQRGLPRKMGGYRKIYNPVTIVRDVFIVPQVPNFNIYLGEDFTLTYLQIDQAGNISGPVIDRTPVGFQLDFDNIWQFDIIFSELDTATKLVAHAAPNLSFITNNVERTIYVGDLYSNTPLTPLPYSVSGGIVVLGPFLVSFGNDGLVNISAPNDPAIIQNTARPTSQKIVFGLPTRAGNSSPGGLLWSLNSLIRMTLVQTTPEPQFAFDVVAGESSILSSSCVIEYDGIYYWCGIDRFLMYQGVIQEVKNDINRNFFFQNLNFAQRQKVWATKVPEFGEIWWHFPFGNAQECNHAVIYNVREKTWYDTPISRSAGYYEQVFADPIWTDNGDVNNRGPFGLWIHETGKEPIVDGVKVPAGYDQNIDGILTPIPAYFETGDIAWAAVGPTGNWTGIDRWVDLYRVEPDFVQSGNLSLTVNGREYARSDVQASVTYTITPQTNFIDTPEQRRFMTLNFGSNTLGGFFELGQTLLQFRVGDDKP